MPSIRELVEEAEENYRTGRHGNSGPLFKRAGLEVFKHRTIPDALYLLYRALLDFEKTGSSIQRLQLIDTIATEMTKQVRKEASKLIEDADDLAQEELITILKLQLTALDRLDQPEAFDAVMSSLIQEYLQLYDQTSQASYIEEALQLRYSDQLMATYLEAAMEEAEQKLSAEGFDSELVALVILLRSCSYLPDQFRNDYREEFASDLEQTLGRLQQMIATLLEEEALDDTGLVTHQMSRYNVEFLQFLVAS